MTEIEALLQEFRNASERRRGNSDEDDNLRHDDRGDAIGQGWADGAGCCFPEGAGAILCHWLIRFLATGKHTTVCSVCILA